MVCRQDDIHLGGRLKRRGGSGAQKAEAYRSMIVPNTSRARPNEEASPLSDPSGHVAHAEYDRRPDGIDARFSVGWRFRLRFTSHAFEPQNRVLRDVIETDGAPARVLVVIDDGILNAAPRISDSIRHYAKSTSDRLELTGELIAIPGGERAKNDRAVFEQITSEINRAGLCRRSYVLVIGGGAVLDVVGFAAAVAHRGVRLVRMPSTVLAQDDSGVGVKNGINAFGKKNFLGTFTPPWAVINDSSLLTTLDDRDWRSGLSECVKVALVKDATLFDDICNASARLVARDLDTTTAIIRRSAEWHLKHIVQGGDPFELTAARPLDFGHWAAHKLEQMTDFDLRHGEAVSIGIALDTTYSTLQGWLSESDRERILTGLRGLGLPTWHDDLSRTSELLGGLEEFREHLGGQLTLAMLRGIGNAFDVHTMDQEVITRAINRLRDEAAAARQS